MGIEYISQHEESQKELFSRKIDWPDAKRIAEKTCLGRSVFTNAEVSIAHPLLEMEPASYQMSGDVFREVFFGKHFVFFLIAFKLWIDKYETVSSNYIDLLMSE